MRKIYESNVGVIDDVAGFDTCRALFLAKTKGEAITLQKSLNAKATGLDIADVLMSLMGEHEVTGGRSTWMMIEGKIATRDVLATVYITDPQEDEYGEPSDGTERPSLGREIRNFKIEVTGHRGDAVALFAILDEKYGHEQLAQIKWWHKEEGRLTYKTLFLPPIKTKLHPAFYPDLSNPTAYLDDYLKSDAAILLIAGAPGTGKTTLLRHLICEFKLSAHIVYDEELMQNDKVFQHFLFEKESDILIIEDADTILTSRENDNNKLMARFLNVSDGLIKLPAKKVVFTTNINDFGRVDPALLRPGRCFDLLHTRLLNLTESQAAARIGGLPIPSGGREYSLAELFNQDRKPVTIRRAGFGR